jgi:SAM-dependent methyltransferase
VKEITDALTQYWRDTEHDPQKMWDSWQAEHRQSVIQAIARLDVHSVYEIGCGAGPNLRLLRERYPKMLLAGGELSRRHQEFANQHFPVDNLQLPVLPPLLGKFDCVLSMYAMAYIEDVPAVLRGLYEQGVKYMVIVEPSSRAFPFWDSGFYEGHAMGCYVHDYKTLAEQAGWRVLWRWPITPHIQGLNVCMVLER